MQVPIISLEQRFWSKVSRKSEDECWPWLGGKSHGYGRFYIRHGVGKQAHRVAYGLLVGSIPNGLDLDHLCRECGCVNPRHLEPVTRRENLIRGVGIPAINIRKLFCPRGHFLDQIVSDKGYIKRRCRRCKNGANSRWRHKNKDKINQKRREIRAST